MTSISAKDWFEHKGDNLLWVTHPYASDTELKFLFESQLQRPYKKHLMVVLWIMIFLWRKKIAKKARFLFTVPVVIPFWGLV